MNVHSGAEPVQIARLLDLDGVGTPASTATH
jgi:hypothetical protein